MDGGEESILYRFWAVNTNWNANNGGWNVNANPVDDANRWNAGNQVFARNSLCSTPPIK